LGWAQLKKLAILPAHVFNPPAEGEETPFASLSADAMAFLQKQE